MEDVAEVLESEGVASFAKSFDELMQSLTDKANALAGGSWDACVTPVARGPRVARPSPRRPPG